jgi:NAD/NADP transhydrogenase alpha subunit
MCAQFAPDEGESVFSNTASILGVLAIAFAMVNVIGGFMVTDRMLAMFSSKKKKK